MMLSTCLTCLTYGCHGDAGARTGGFNLGLSVAVVFWVISVAMVIDADIPPSSRWCIASSGFLVSLFPVRILGVPASDVRFYVFFVHDRNTASVAAVSDTLPVVQICRIIWGSGSVRSSHQTVSDYTLRQWFPNIQQSRFLTACRRLEKLPSISDANRSCFMMWNLQGYTTSVVNVSMWQFMGGGGYTSLTPSCIFSDGYDLPNPQDLHRCSVHFGTIRLTTQLFVPDTCLRVSLQPFLFKTYQIHVTCSNVLHEKQEAQLMLTDQRDAFRGQSRSPNVVPFDRLGMVSYYSSIVTLSLKRTAAAAWRVKAAVNKAAWWPWPLTLKVVSESHVTWATSVPILVFLGLSVLDLGPMYATDTSDKSIA